jgi:hypothetical protein
MRVTGPKSRQHGKTGPLKDIFAVQDEIVGKVVTTLGLLLKVDEMKLPHPGCAQPTESLEAFDDLLRAAEYIFRATEDDNGKAQQWLEKAIALDPKCAGAYALLGWLHMFAARTNGARIRSRT